MEEVYQKATKLFREKGYLRTTMNDIAQELDIKKGSLYYYIKDKETLLFEILDRITDILANSGASVSLDHLSTQEKLDRLIHEHFMNVKKYKNEIPLLVYEVKNLRPDQRDIIIKKRREYEEAFLKVIREGIADGTFLDHNHHVVAFFILGGAFWFSQWFSGEEVNGRQVNEDSFVRLFLNGLLTRRTL
jgi:AcrR family transcriptional regulator